MLTIKLERDLNPPDYSDCEPECVDCGKELAITNHDRCIECAEVRILDMARNNSTFLSEIIVGEYVANMDDYSQRILYAWESNDADKAFDAILDAFSGAVLESMRGKL